MNTKTATLKKLLSTNVLVMFMFFAFSGMASSLLVRNLLHNGAPNETQVRTAYASIQIPFIENRGQVDPKVKYYAALGSGVFFVENDGTLTYRLDTAKNGGVAIRENFGGTANSPVGTESGSATKVNIIRGGNAENWKTNLATYAGVDLGFIYPGINVTLKAQNKNVEKIFTVNPGANPSDISLKISGADKLEIGKNGNLELKTAKGTIEMTAPLAYQEINGAKTNVPVSYKLTGAANYGFSVSAYDRDYPLVIDPLLASTFLGSPTSAEGGGHIAMDGNGKIFITGQASDSAYPVSAGAYDSTFGGTSTDVVVSRLDANLSVLEASTYIGGGDADTATGIAIDSGNNVYITGNTTSSDFPATSGAYDVTFGVDAENPDVFIAKLGNNLDTLLASTSLGNDRADYGNAISIMPGVTESVLVAGKTKGDFPVTEMAFDQTPGADGQAEDGFASRLDTGLTSLIASTYIGGAAPDYAGSISGTLSGAIYIAGATTSQDFPATPDSYNSTHNGSNGAYDGFLCKLDGVFSDTGRVCTFLGGAGNDYINSIFPTADSIYVAGATDSEDFPTSAGAYSKTKSGDVDGFITKFSPDMTQLQSSTYYGGGAGDGIHSQINNVTVNSAETFVYVNGSTNSASLPVTAGSYDATFPNGSGDDLFIADFSASLNTLYAATYMGGSNNDVPGYGLMLDPSGTSLYFGGVTWSTDYPITTDAFGNTGNGEFFISKIDSFLATEPPGDLNTLTANPGKLSVSLNWVAPPGNPTGYTIEYGTVAGGAFDQICTTTDCINEIPGATVTDLLQDTEYMFRVTPLNPEGTGKASNEVSVTATGPCSGMESEQFCGTQVITAPTLRFISIPTSFDFPTVSLYGTPAGTTQQPELTTANYGKAQVIDTIPEPGTFPPIDISGQAQKVYNNGNPTTQPALADLLGIQDNRNSGGFEVQVQVNGTFTNGSNTIPLSNLYVATSVASPVYSVPASDTAYSCPATNCGVVYGTSVTERGISAPADSQGNSLGMPYAFGQNFGSGAVVLMDGGLPADHGRDGYVYQFLSYYLNVPAFQAAGDYAARLTFTLIDDTL